MCRRLAGFWLCAVREAIFLFPHLELRAELCPSQNGEEGEVLGEVGAVLSHMHGSSVNEFQGHFMQAMPDLQALLFHPCSRSLYSKGPSGCHPIQSLGGS